MSARASAASAATAATTSKRAQLSSHKKQGLLFLSQALQCEEEEEESKTSREDIITMYRLGIKELDAVIQLAYELQNVSTERSEWYREAAEARREAEAGRRNAADRVAQLRADGLLEEAGRRRRERRREEEEEEVVVVEKAKGEEEQQRRRPERERAVPRAGFSPSRRTDSPRPARWRPTSGGSLPPSSPVRRPAWNSPTTSSMMRNQGGGGRTSTLSTAAVIRRLESGQYRNHHHHSQQQQPRQGNVGYGRVSTDVAKKQQVVGGGREGGGCDQFEEQVKGMMVRLKADGATRLDDVVGHAKAKDAIRESVILPALRPELFSGLLSPPKGILLFGPPGNGKTMLARALAGETKSKSFFNVTAAALTSKFVGEGEKMVRALFDVARKEAPAIVFIDEIDSLLSSRSSGEHSADRRIKTEFFSSVDGLISGKDNRGILLVAATNRPQEIDDAALRRFTKRIYIPMPDFQGRRQLITMLMSEHGDPLSPTEVAKVAALTDGYSGSDLANLARDAAMGPIREIPAKRLLEVRKEDIRRVSLADFQAALGRIRTSVDASSLALFDRWNQKFGDVS